VLIIMMGRLLLVNVCDQALMQVKKATINIGNDLLITVSGDRKIIKFSDLRSPLYPDLAKMILRYRLYPGLS
jgi:hypothetical protein